MNPVEQKEYIRVIKRNHSLETQIKELIEANLKRSKEESDDRKKLTELKLLYQQAQIELDKVKQPKATLGQKMCLLHHFGIIDFINGLQLEQTQKYKLLSYVTDAHEKNVQEDFNSPVKYEDSHLNNASNNKFLVKVFKEFNDEISEKWAQARLDKK